jgi:outer membrane protein TolC
MKLQIKLIILLITILFTTTGFAQDNASKPLVIDKDTVIKLALENNDLIRAAEMMVESALADGKAQYAPFQPQLSTNYSYTRLDKAPTTVFDLGDGPQTIPVGNADNYKWSLDFVFPLYTGGADTAIKKMIKINKGMAENNLDTARRGISFGALQAYFGVLSTLNAVNVRQASLDALTKAYEDAVKSEREGIFSNSEVLQIEVAKNKAEMELTSIEVWSCH